jgi:hypothetical protein
MELTKQQIGRCGELLVRQRLLLKGIESAPMTTDSGVDLVAYSPRKKGAITIQVKTNWKAKPGGGKGKPAIDWWIPEDSPAQIFALVELDRDRIWLFTATEISQLAQQHPHGRYHFFMAVDPTAMRRRDGKAFHEYEFEKFLLENRVHEIL